MRTRLVRRKGSINPELKLYPECSHIFLIVAKQVNHGETGWYDT